MTQEITKDPLSETVNFNLNNYKKTLETKFNSQGFPTTSHENWLYWAPDQLHSALLNPCKQTYDLNDESADICIVNGVIVSVSKKLNELKIVETTPSDKLQKLNLDVSSSSISILNSMHADKLIMITVTDNLKDTITISNISTCDESNVSTVCKVLILAKEKSRSNFVVNHNSDLKEENAVNTSFHIIAKKESSISINHIFKDQIAVSFFHSMIYLYENSKCSHLTFVTNSKLVRHDTEAHFYEEGADLKCSGVGILKKDEQFYNHLKINHYAKDCTAQQFFKNILDEVAIAEFSGLVFVHEGAHGVDSTQSNKTLLLSNNARVLSRPQLKIDADDVQCAHGSTIGQLNPEEIFYITSRGLTTKQAKALLVFGFAEEIIINIKDEILKSTLESYIKESLSEINIQ